MKRAASGGSEPSSKKRKVTFTTYKKWAIEFDSDFKTLTWLDCETRPYKKRQTESNTSQNSTSDSEEDFLLDRWDDWMGSDSDTEDEL